MNYRFNTISGCEHRQPFAECADIDLSGNLSNATVQLVKQKLLTHGLLVFRNQHQLTPAAELRFNQAFGWHDPLQAEFLFGFGAPSDEHRISGGAQIPETPQVSVLGNVFLDDYYGIGNTQLKPVLGFTYSAWHADGLHDMLSGMPELTTMYNPSGYVASGGGETYFSSGVLAVEEMPARLYAELSQCSVAYMRAPNDEFPDESRRVTTSPSYMVDEGTRRIGFAKDLDNPAAGITDFELKLEHADGGGQHPCIRRHPVTGQESLYITPSKAVCLIDSKTGKLRHGIEDTSQLLSEALLPVAAKNIRYEHRWQEGDFVAWLNTLVLHSASDPSEIEGSRLMHRVRLSTPKN
jgi:alpha-ketoglutarate-dependent taurine dioxygenase